MLIFVKKTFNFGFEKDFKGFKRVDIEAFNRRVRIKYIYALWALQFSVFALFMYVHT